MKNISNNRFARTILRSNLFLHIHAERRSYTTGCSRCNEYGYLGDAVPAIIYFINVSCCTSRTVSDYAMAAAFVAGGCCVAKQSEKKMRINDLRTCEDNII